MTPLRERSAQAVADAWNVSVPSKYRIDGALVEANLFGHPLFHEGASFWFDGTFVAVKRSAAGLYEGPDAKTAHLALLGGEGVPHRALEGTIEGLRKDGYETLVLGTDSGHFLPGAPTDVPWLGWFLKSFGFERGGLAFDLERDLRDFPCHAAAFPSEKSLRTLESADVPALDGFLQREFPGRWRYDVMRKVDAEGPGTVFGLVLQGRVQGFALLQEQGCHLPIGGAIWRADLGDRWGSLGPIGVSRDLRGRSHGIEVLHAALCELQARGARRTIIDWTGLIDFYGTQGFSVARSYRSYRLSLRADPGSGA